MTRAASPRWVPGPPPGPGRYWVVWAGWPNGIRIEAVEISPALIYRSDPRAPLQIKTLSGCAYQLSLNIADLTHHMPLVAPPPPLAAVPGIPR